MARAGSRLTKRVVDEATPKSERYFVWDGELKGLGIRVEASGTKTYILRYRPRDLSQNAPKRFVTLGRHGVVTADEARARARAILGSVASGNDPVVDRLSARAAISVADMVEAFLEEHVKAKRKSSTAVGYDAILKTYVVPTLGRRKAELVATSDIAKLHLSLRDRPYQANRVLAIIGSMYGFAARNGHIAKGTNPATGIERFRETKRERFLGADELDRLGETLRLAETDGLPWRLDSGSLQNKHVVKEPRQRTVIPPEAILAIRLLLLTGARLREILNLEWGWIDFERGLIYLPDSKTGKKTIVLSELALIVLKEPNRVCDYVVPTKEKNRPRSDLKKPWRAIQKHANLEGVRIHDLRHTFASIGAGANLGLPIVGKLLGHSQPSTTARYAHLDADPLRRAVDLIGEKLVAATRR